MSHKLASLGRTLPLLINCLVLACAAAVALVACCGLCLAQAATRPAEALRVPFPGTRMTLVKPAGFVLQHGAVGFMDPHTRAVLMASESSRPFAALLKEIQSGDGQWRGLAPEPRELRFGDHTGRAFARTHENGDDPITEFIAVFGDDTGSIIVKGITTRSMGDKIRETMRQAALSVRWKPKASLLDSLPFSVTKPSVLEFIAVKPDSLTFTLAPLDDKPRLVISYDDAAMPAVEREAWIHTCYGPGSAEAQLGIDHFESLKIQGRAACEVIRTRQTGSGMQIIYEAEVFDVDRRYRFQGYCLPDERKTHVPAFQQAFRSLRIRDGQ